VKTEAYALKHALVRPWIESHEQRRKGKKPTALLFLKLMGKTIAKGRRWVGSMARSRGRVRSSIKGIFMELENLSSWSASFPSRCAPPGCRPNTGPELAHPIFLLRQAWPPDEHATGKVEPFSYVPLRKMAYSYKPLKSWNRPWYHDTLFFYLPSHSVHFGG
jgi:hypothetical protein